MSLKKLPNPVDFLVNLTGSHFARVRLLHGLQIRNIAKRRMLEPDEEFKARPDLTESKLQQQFSDSGLEHHRH